MAACVYAVGKSSTSFNGAGRKLGVKLYPRVARRGGALCARLRPAIRVAHSIGRPERSATARGFDSAEEGTRDVAGMCPACKAQVASLEQLRPRVLIWQKPPLAPERFAEQLGPHLNFTPAGGWAH